MFMFVGKLDSLGIGYIEIHHTSLSVGALMDTAWLKIGFVCFWLDNCLHFRIEILLAFIGALGPDRHNTTVHSFFFMHAPPFYCLT